MNKVKTLLLRDNFIVSFCRKTNWFGFKTLEPFSNTQNTIQKGGSHAFTQQQKEEFMRRAEAKMEEYTRQMEELMAKALSGATELKEESKAEFKQDMEELCKKKQEFA
jgi:hypothetical protein